MGQTTSYRKEILKPNVLVLGENKPAREARYIHGEKGKCLWTLYGAHDPEDYRHLTGDPPTDLSLHPNSPGYRLILNNVLFPAAKKKNIIQTQKKTNLKKSKIKIIFTFRKAKFQTGNFDIGFWNLFDNCGL